MNHGLWIARKNQVCSLVKKVSDWHGGDDIDWLRAYGRQLVEDHPGERIEEALTCFMGLVDQLKWVSRRT